MFKLKMLINAILILTFLLCLFPSVNSIAGDCGDNGAGAGTPTATGNYVYPPGHTCTEDPDLIYDTVNSNETIDRNGSAALVVIGNNAPFIWSVSGSGFSLENEGQPTGPTNTLYADDTACGAATITVTGCDGEEVKGYVRCTNGVWTKLVTYSPNHPSGWEGNNCWGGCDSSPVTGSYGSLGSKVYQYFNPVERVYMSGGTCDFYFATSGSNACQSLSALSATYTESGLTKDVSDFVLLEYGVEASYGTSKRAYTFDEWNCP